MTVGELLVLNSTLPADSGYTVLDHLQNIAIERDVYCSVNADITEDIEINIDSAIISADIVTKQLEIDIKDETNIENTDTIIGVEVCTN